MKAIYLAWAAGFGALSVLAGVTTYPAPPDEQLSDDYRILAGGQPVDVYRARTLDPPFAGKEWDFGGDYSFANFDVDGAIEVRITAKRSLRDTVVRPASAGVTTRIEGDGTLVLSLPGPRKISIEPDGKRGPLLLFANPLEVNPPRPGAPGVIHFAPGIHRPGRIVVTNGQTLYLAGGAVVKGGILAHGENIRITGRGILDGSDYEWRQGPTPHVVSIVGTNVEVSGLTIRGASHWTIVPRDSRHVTIRDVKLCGSRVQNDDGINPCNSQDVLITGCFIRSDDDCVALKGLAFSAANSNVERITVENSTLWCDRARIFLLGHESRAAFMRDITLRNLDIIHFTMTPFLFEPGEEMRLEAVTVEDVRLHGEGQDESIRLKPVVNQYMRNRVPGHVADVRFRNVTVTGAPGKYRIQLEGADEAHAVRDVTFENVSVIDAKLTGQSERLQVGEHVKGVRFESK
ncbi:MAG: glycosyl hydrolase family 28 protein [Limisphaerales bacterium]